MPPKKGPSRNRASIPSYDDGPAPSTVVVDSESQGSSFDLVATPPLVPPLDGTFRLSSPPPGSPVSRGYAGSDIDYAEVPPNHSSEAFAGADMPRVAEEPRMGDYFQKRRDLLNILKSLHSTGQVSFTMNYATLS